MQYVFQAVCQLQLISRNLRKSFTSAWPNSCHYDVSNFYKEMTSSATEPSFVLFASIVWRKLPKLQLYINARESISKIEQNLTSVFYLLSDREALWSLVVLVFSSFYPMYNYRGKVLQTELSRKVVHAFSTSLELQEPWTDLFYFWSNHIICRTTIFPALLRSVARISKTRAIFLPIYFATSSLYSCTKFYISSLHIKHLKALFSKNDFGRTLFFSRWNRSCSIGLFH